MKGLTPSLAVLYPFSKGWQQCVSEPMVKNSLFYEKAQRLSFILIWISSLWMKFYTFSIRWKEYEGKIRQTCPTLKWTKFPYIWHLVMTKSLVNSSEPPLLNKGVKKGLKVSKGLNSSLLIPSPGKGILGLKRLDFKLFFWQIELEPLLLFPNNPQMMPAVVGQWSWAEARVMAPMTGEGRNGCVNIQDFFL